RTPRGRGGAAPPTPTRVVQDAGCTCGPWPGIASTAAAARSDAENCTAFATACSGDGSVRHSTTATHASWAAIAGRSPYESRAAKLKHTAGLITSGVPAE